MSAVVTVASVRRIQNAALRTGYTRRFTAVSAKLGVRENRVVALCASELIDCHWVSLHKGIV